MNRFLISSWAFVVLMLVFGASLAATPPTVWPAEVRLQRVGERQRVLVHENLPTGDIGGVVTGEVKLTTRDQTVVKIDGHQVVAVGEGTTSVEIQVGDDLVAIPVTVNLDRNSANIRFTRDVLPVLSRAGCNSGACHGALAGKGGFRLSLAGYDPVGDHRRITIEADGRRIELADPGRSLVLAKPSGAIVHKGGLKLPVDSAGYRTVAEWIAQGAAGPNDPKFGPEPKLVSVKLFPPEVVVRPGQPLAMMVMATYADGQKRDVTDLAKFISTDEAIARVDTDGNITVLGHGVGAITVWYSSQIAVARLVSPYEYDVPDSVYADEPSANFVDELVTAQLRKLNLAPNPLCDDETFVRRAYVDTIGLIPTRDEVETFVADPRDDKRQRLVDELLGREEFVDYWAYKWSDIFLISGTSLRPNAVKSYYQFVRNEVAANTPWDRLVRKVITARGDSLVRGEANFYAVHQDPESMSENVAQAFLGLSIGCAKCHNHPLEKWTNDQYYAMANHFSRVRAKGWGGEVRNGDGSRTIYVVDRGELIQPLTGKPQPPTPLDGTPIAFDDPRDRRDVLADWLTSADNEAFARAITNRVWANFFGIGLVESVDDLRASNPPRNEPLMRAAADYLVEHDFDLKVLMRAILTSRTYQRSSLPSPLNKDDSHYFSRYFPRRMMAEVLHDAICQVTNVPTTFNEIAFPGADTEKTNFYPLGTRAVELYDSAVKSYFLQSHGRNPREIVCECERTAVPSMTQMLHLCNGDTLLGKLRDPQSRVTTLLEQIDDVDGMIDDVYLRSLARRPTARERAELTEMISAATVEDRRVVIEDFLWAVMSSREFLFQH